MSPSLLRFPVFHNQSVTADTSIAIWNKNRIVVVLAVGVWMINIGFLIQGESERLFPADWESDTSTFELRYCPGKDD